jgi:hypothetical protein
MSRCLAAAFLLLILAAPATCAAGDRIWSAVVLATKEDPPARVPAMLEEFAPAIQKVFGYNSLYLLGEKKRELYDGGEEWLVPTKEFFLKVQCLARGVSAYTLRIELYHGKNLLVTTEAKLARDAPLYIRGPEWGRGQLLFVLEVR